MKQWEKSKAASRSFALMRNELRRAGPPHIECADRLPEVGTRVMVMAEDASGRYGLPFAVKFVEHPPRKIWVRDDGRVIEAKIVAWRPA